MSTWLRITAGAGLLALGLQVPVGLAQDTKSPQKAPADTKAAPAKPGEAKAKGISIVSPWARATPGGSKVGAAFFEIQVAVGADDKLIGAASPAAQTVELHDHIRDGGIVKMRRIEAMPVPGGKTITLKPGGLHLMLMELKDGLKEGEAIEVTLTFEKAGTVKVQVPILKLGTMAAPAEAGSGSGSDGGSGSGAGSGSGSKP